VSIKPGQLADQGACNLNDWDAECGGVEDHLLQGVASLRHHQEADRLSARGEGLLYRPTPSDHLVLGADHAGNLQGDRPS
jgi:hypothetical protein